MKNIIKISQRMISMLLVLVMTATFLPLAGVFAEGNEKYPYTMFASSYEDGAITINAYNINVNGNICTNGTIFTPSSNANINGTKQEKADESMIYIMEKLNNTYFSGSNVEKHEDDYVLEDMNININNPVEVSGEIELTGNINLSTGLKATDDISLNGEVENTNNSVIYSESGNIIIDTTNVNLNGLIYAPCGNIEITAQNLNMNNVILIAQKIIINCPSLNANYSSQMAEFVGTESEKTSDPEDVDSDFELFAFAEYIAENNSLNIFWETTVEQGIFEIFSSDDNVNFISEGTVSDSQEYIYSITNDFEKKYFKVSETTSNGKTVESVAFVVVKTEDGYEVQLLDSDEDGLPDIYEEMYGTDKYNPDTDEDGLTDYEEIYITGTDPLVYDSVTEGISDANADSDGDGISNRDEINFGTDPLNIDTDNDGLTDYDELFDYDTDPLNPDSDEDGISDGDEIKIRLDPLNPETFGYPDIEYVSEQTISADSEIFDEVNTEESPYEVELEITAAGYAEGSLSATESSYSYAISNDCMLGDSIELEYTCNVENIVLKYTIKEEYLDNVLGTYADCEEFQGIKRLNVFKYFDDINMLLPIETQFDVENNLLYAEVDELGTYCIMDMEMWFEVLGIEAAETVELNSEEQELQDFQIMSVYDELELEDIQDEGFELQAAASASANSTYISGDFEYTINNGTACITKYTGTASNLEVPSVIGGYSVTSIGDLAFRDQSKLTSIFIPDSVTNIGVAAFCNCTNLTSVVIPDSVTSTGEGAFSNCTNLTSVFIPYGVTNIGNQAFINCKSLTNIIIPDSVTNIGKQAFNSCQLTSITIPNSVTYIGEGAFAGCPLTSVTIPSGVTSIEIGAFAHCESLTNIIIPNSVTSIKEFAFLKCTSLKNITIPNNVTSIKQDAFTDCINLTSITIPNKVINIGARAFSNCINLEDIVISNGVVSISPEAFINCTNLISIIIPDSVKSIWTGAFLGCDKITIYGNRGSYAERFALAENIKFVDLLAPTEPFEALVGTKWKKIKLDGELNATNGIDTDSDSLFDWEEVNTKLLKWNVDGSFDLPTFIDAVAIEDCVYAYKAFDRWKGTQYELPILNEVWYREVLPIFSDPTDVDSDGDKFPDKYCSSIANQGYYPYNDPNPLRSDVTETMLKNDFFSVDYEYKGCGVENCEIAGCAKLDWSSYNNGNTASYGGYQGWFGSFGTTSYDKIFCNRTVTGLGISREGCGIIALADMFLYMAIGDSKYNPTYLPELQTMLDLGSNYSHINFDTYAIYIAILSNYFIYMPIFSGIAGDGLLFSNLESGARNININNYMPLQEIKWQSDTSDTLCLSNMKKMLNNNISVVYSYFNYFIAFPDLQLYKLEDMKYTENGGTKVKSHFMVATGIIEYSKDVEALIGHSKMIKTATYGEEYYVDYDFYATFLSHATNILYIEK